MPKFSRRCKPRGRLPPVATVAFCAPPRKVSFEDGHGDSDSSRSASPVQGSGPMLVPDESGPLTPKLPTMRRPKSSLSLVELAKDMDREDDNVNTHRHRISADERLGVLNSPAQSPLSSPSSPWGYFVDMAIPLDGPREGRPSSNPPFICHEKKSSCRRRCSNPYGDYKKQRRESLTSEFRRSIPLPSGIQLTPRKMQESVDQSDQLIGALDRLQVD